MKFLKEKNIKRENNKSLTFHKINLNKFPAIRLAYKVLDMGGLAPHIFNYNNEVLTRMISLSLRHGTSVSHVVEQLKKDKNFIKNTYQHGLVLTQP